MNKKTTIIIIVFIVVGAFFSYFVIGPAIWGFRLHGAIQQRKNLILEETNHKELLSACQNILENHADYFETDDPNWPSVIKKLEPNYVRVIENELDIVMGGGWFYWGIIVCDEDPKIPNVTQRKLLDGMWFYEEK